MGRQTAAGGPGVHEGNEATDPADSGQPVPAVAGRRADPWRAGFFVLLLLGVAAVAVWLVFGSRLLVVRHVQVAGSDRLVPSAEVRRAAAVVLGTRLADLNTGAVARRVERIDAVASAQVSRSWPATIVITVKERTPVLAVPSDGKYKLIDGSGVTVRWASRKPARMPLLASPPAVLRGDPAIRAAVSVLRELPARLRQQVRSVAAPAADAVTLRLAGGTTVRWGGTGQPGLKAAELRVLMRAHASYYDVSDPSTAVTAG